MFYLQILKFNHRNEKKNFNIQIILWKSAYAIPFDEFAKHRNEEKDQHSNNTVKIS